MSNVVVLDASALLAAMLDEPGGNLVIERADRAVISAVNLSEVVARLQDRGAPDLEVDRDLASADLTVIPFDAALAITAGRLRASTRSRGLSFGDRACLALGRHLGATVLTADKAWADLDVGVAVEVIR